MSLRSRIVDGIFGALELGASLYDWVRELRKPNAFPPERGSGQEFRSVDSGRYVSTLADARARRKASPSRQR